MIRTENEYRETLKRIERSDEAFRKQETELRAKGLNREQIKRATEPGRTFHRQIKDEVASYERLKRAEFDELTNLQGLGQMVIGLRIALGLSQRQLAEKLGVHESQVSRDERNEYHGITVERAKEIFDALGVEVTTRVERLPAFSKAS
jgi:ribosome-binding protein aMBF1 (putative translation factor)